MLFFMQQRINMFIQELHPWTAVNTNLGGIKYSKLSDKYLVDKFVLVSTDKAVNPVNVMGATKRAAGKIIQSYSNSKTTFMAVRRHVLGSSGSNSNLPKADK